MKIDWGALNARRAEAEVEKWKGRISFVELVAYVSCICSNW